MIPSLTNLAQGTALAIVCSVFVSGAFETEASVAKLFPAIVDGGNRFAVNRFVILFSTINVSSISAIFLLLDLTILVTPRLVTLLRLDRVSFCSFPELIH